MSDGTLAESSITALVLVDDTLYFTDDDFRGVRRVPVTGGDLTTVMDWTIIPTGGQGLALDST